MSCYRCTKPFSLFNKEYGCKNCGFSVCSKCLSHKIEVPKLNNRVEKVCGTCFKTLSNPSKPDKPPSPPANFKRRLEAASNNPDATRPKPSNMVQAKPKPKVDKNSDLHSRLNNLKGISREPPPSTDEIKKRLDALRMRTEVNKQDSQITVPNVKSNQPFKSTPPKSQEDQVRDLLTRYKEENQLDNPGRTDGGSPEFNITDDGNIDDTEALMKQAAAEMELQAKKELEDLKKDDEIRKKLESLRGKEMKNRSDKDDVIDSEEEDDEAKTQRLIAQILAQDQLDSRFERDCSGFQPTKAVSSQPQRLKPEYDEDNDMIWCCICNEDATLRCRGCDDDLYCKRCYKEGHSKADYADHSTVPVKTR